MNPFRTSGNPFTQSHYLLASSGAEGGTLLNGNDLLSDFTSGADWFQGTIGVAGLGVVVKQYNPIVMMGKKCSFACGIELVTGSPSSLVGWITTADASLFGLITSLQIASGNYNAVFKMPNMDYVSCDLIGFFIEGDPGVVIKATGLKISTIIENTYKKFR